MFRLSRAVFLFLLILNFTLFAQDRNKKIVILGSSMAAGWVTSYQEKYDMQNGYAYRLGRLLEPNGWEVINISIPGYDTKSTIERFNDDVLPLDPGYVFIGLSMSNEGLETGDPDSVFLSYNTGIRELIRLCGVNDIEPVLGLCYSNNNYTEKQYGYLKKMNRLINLWEVPCVNLLGVLDDGHGHFPDGYTFDPNHPDDRGHEEMFYAFVPDMFDALHDSKDELFSLKSSPEDTLHFGSADFLLHLGRKAKFSEVSYVPSEVMHSFTLAFQFRVDKAGKIAEIISMQGVHDIRLNKKGQLVYNSPNGEIISSSRISANTTYWVTVTHQYLTGVSYLYLNTELQGKVDESLEPLCFTLGKHKNEVAYNKLFLFRAALNPEEVRMLYHEKQYHGSMELRSPLPYDDDELSGGQGLQNLALSHQYAVLDPDNIQAEIEVLKAKVKEAEYARENELKVEHRTAIDIDPALLEQYTGSYEIEPGDNMLVVKEGNKLFLDDHGRKAEILPEGDDQFFIKYPADILVIFHRDEDGMISKLIFSINGREMHARKME